jgi:rhodanese-related sulfurtransferase
MLKLGRAPLAWMLALLVVVLVVIAFVVLLGQPSGLARILDLTQVEPSEVAQATRSSIPPVLLDVRTEAEYRSEHVAGAAWAPLADLGNYVASHPVADERIIVTICAHDRRSAVAAATIAALGHARVASLAGGTVRWRELGLPLETGLGEATQSPVAVVPTTPFEQLLTVTTAFVIKPIYMLLALVLGVRLWRRSELDLALLGRGMLLFFVGEALCAIRVLGGPLPDLLEMGHGLGMVAMGTCLSWGLAELVDQRVLGLSDANHTCIVGRFCQACWKREPVSCGVQRTMRFLLPAFVLLCLLPLSAEPRPMKINYLVFGTVVVDEVTPLIAIAQMRLYPILGLWFFVVAFVRLRKPSALEKAKAPFFVGLGFLSFSLLRFFLQHAFGQAVVWANAWEELTELATVLSLIAILWIFRGQLGLVARTEQPPHTLRPRDEQARASDGERGGSLPIGAVALVGGAGGGRRARGRALAHAPLSRVEALRGRRQSHLPRGD